MQRQSLWQLASPIVPLPPQPVPFAFPKSPRLLNVRPMPETNRSGWLHEKFPSGVPKLWCPLITPYDESGNIDQPRFAAHFTHVATWAKGFLIPGSTGDGWELNDGEANTLRRLAQSLTKKTRTHLLVGVLKSDAASAIEAIQTVAREIAPTDSFHEPGSASCGFTICPPRGEGLTQAALESALAEILELGFPMALYQLPQMTRNEMSPALVSSLAARFDNFFLFKDSSGTDRVALSESPLHAVVTLRGAEDDYARWLKPHGPYDGFLLSTANCFAKELSEIITAVGEGQPSVAAALSARLDGVVREVFAGVAQLPEGNAFANANKSMDHFFAFGPNALNARPPRLHAGSRIPVEVLRVARDALFRHGFLPRKGYLE